MGLPIGIRFGRAAGAISPGQSAEIDRVTQAYPALIDDGFVRANLDAWLS